MNKAIRLVLFCCLAAAPLLAQLPTDSPVDVLRHPGWNKGVFIGGGTSVASSPSGQNFLLGFRLGRVLTNEHGSGFLRGTFEMAGDIIPLDEYWINGAPVRCRNQSVHLQVELHQALQGCALFRGGGRRALQHPRSAATGHRNVNFTSGPEIGRADFPRRSNLLGRVSEGLSPVQCFDRQSQSRHQCVTAIHVGIHVVLRSAAWSGAPAFMRGRSALALRKSLSFCDAL